MKTGQCVNRLSALLFKLSRTGSTNMGVHDPNTCGCIDPLKSLLISSSIPSPWIPRTMFTPWCLFNALGVYSVMFNTNISHKVKPTSPLSNWNLFLPSLKMRKLCHSFLINDIASSFSETSRKDYFNTCYDLYYILCEYYSITIKSLSFNWAKHLE